MLELEDLSALEEHIYQDTTGLGGLEHSQGVESRTYHTEILPFAEYARYGMDPALRQVHEHLDARVPFKSVAGSLGRAGALSKTQRKTFEREFLGFYNALLDFHLRPAVMLGHCAVARLLIARKTTIELELLILAITWDKLNIVEILVASEKLDEGSKQRGLEKAAWQGRLGIFTFFVNCGTDINGSDCTQPLTAAIAARKADVVEELILRGADIEASGKRSMVDKPNATPLIAGVAGNHMSAVRAILDAGARVEHYRKKQKRPLMIAIEGQFPDIVVLLLDYGIDLSSMVRPWEQILHLAVEKDHVWLARAAIRAGVNVDADIKYYGCFLQFAAASGSGKILKLLIQAGASVENLEPINNMGRPFRLGGNCPLAAFVSIGDVECVRTLLEHGATKQQAWGDHGDLLQTAAYLGHYGIVDFFSTLNWISSLFTSTCPIRAPCARQCTVIGYFPSDGVKVSLPPALIFRWYGSWSHMVQGCHLKM